MTIVIDGKKAAADLLEKLRKKIRYKNLKLCIIMVGEDDASKIYVNMKRKACEKVGIESDLLRFPANVSEKALIEKIVELNSDELVTGILVQLPLPKNFNVRNILDSIAENKDVDGLSTRSLGKLFAGEKTIVPATPKGMIKLLEIYNIPLRGKEVVIVGVSNLVGKPLGLLCVNNEATVTFANSKTPDLKFYTENADIIMTATGVAGLIKKDMVKEGVVVIDIGISRVNGKVVGDVDFDNVKEKASYITPVPGGAGPMTIAMLIENLIEISEDS